MPSIFRDAKYNELADRLALNALSSTGQRLFDTFMDLMIFAAAIGFSSGKRIPLETKGLEIREVTFENNQKDGLIYLLALINTKDGNILRDENSAECWKIFEEYANGGMQILDNYLNSKATDIDGVDSLINLLKEFCLASQDTYPVEEPEINF